MEKSNHSPSQTKGEPTMSDLPAHPPAGQKRYKAYTRKIGENPFRGSGVSNHTQVVDVDKNIPLEQVEEWAREAAKEGGFELLRLEEVT